MIDQTYSVFRGFRLDLLDDANRQKILEFWKKRGIQFDTVDDAYFHGERGQKLANLYASNPARMPSVLTITWFDSMLDCHLAVNIFGQCFTDWNKAYLQLEMSNFESYMIIGDDRRELWSDFQSAHTRHIWMWYLSGGILANRMTPKQRKRYLVTAY